MHVCAVRDAPPTPTLTPTPTPTPTLTLRHHCIAVQSNYFFRLSKYQPEVEALLAGDDFVQPASRRNEVGVHTLPACLPAG